MGGELTIVIVGMGLSDLGGNSGNYPAIIKKTSFYYFILCMFTQSFLRLFPNFVLLTLLIKKPGNQILFPHKIFILYPKQNIPQSFCSSVKEKNKDYIKCIRLYLKFNVRWKHSTQTAPQEK